MYLFLRRLSKRYSSWFCFKFFFHISSFWIQFSFFKFFLFILHIYYIYLSTFCSKYFNFTTVLFKFIKTISYSFVMSVTGSFSFVFRIVLKWNSSKFFFFYLHWSTTIKQDLSWNPITIWICSYLQWTFRPLSRSSRHDENQVKYEKSCYDHQLRV